MEMGKKQTIPFPLYPLGGPMITKYIFCPSLGCVCMSVIFICTEIYYYFYLLIYWFIIIIIITEQDEWSGALLKKTACRKRVMPEGRFFKKTNLNKVLKKLLISYFIFWRFSPSLITLQCLLTGQTVSTDRSFQAKTLDVPLCVWPTVTW